MPNRRRNQTGIFSHATQGYTQPRRSRGEDIYGNDFHYGNEYDGDAFHSPRRPVATPYVGAGDQSWRSQSYDDRDRRDFGNYGKGGYYGNTYDQQNEDWSRVSRRDGWRSSDDRYAEGRRRDNDRASDDFNSRSGYGEGDSRRFSSWEDGRSDRNQWQNESGGLHRGKGPRGYQRGDERIRDDINDRLADDAYIDATEIEVTVLHGEVTLTGTVDDRNAKRRAEDLCEAVSGVRNVENRLRVKEQFGEYDRKGASTTGTDDTRETSRKRNVAAETARSVN